MNDQDNVYNFSKKKYEKTRSTIFKFLFYIILVILPVIIGFYVIDINQPAIIQARYGEITDSFHTEALIVRDEKIFFAPIDGKVELKQKEGKRINYGNQVISIHNHENLTLYNPEAGILSYTGDGLETILTPDNLSQITVEDFDNINRDYSRLVNGEKVERGEPLYRIVNNYRLYLIIKASIEEGKRYSRNEVIFVRDKKTDSDLIEGRIIQIKMSGNNTLLKIKLDRFVEHWLNMRWLNIELVKNIYRGIVIPREAVFTEPRGQGVLTLTINREYKFKNIVVENGTAEKVVVEGLEIGDNVLREPSQVNYGRGGNE